MSLTKPAPYTGDAEAVAALERCDFSVKISKDSAGGEGPLPPRPVRVYSDGIFDLFHYGHAQQFAQAKAAFPNVYLIVGVCGDKMVTKFKAKPFQCEKERYEVVRNCRHVDEVQNVLKDAPWIITQEFIEENKIDFIAHDDAPYPCGNIADIYGIPKKKNFFLPTKRTEEVSSLELVSRIVREYDDYVKRNRSKGYTGKELSYLFSM
ncbi:Choline-phosphate cytidylyltransferase A [Tyrophagus putrescentiae]|nr:Choline-phosphate cytidylyltransferase A [Tyrophagus putrescentiae]